ncbi:MAG: hypothetical protein ACR2OU_11575, partial [Thermomicrobiales bacterium]
MPVKTNNGLETMTLVLTETQATELRAIRDERKTAINRISLSDVAREVVAAGLSMVSVARNTDSMTMNVSP